MRFGLALSVLLFPAFAAADALELKLVAKLLSTSRERPSLTVLAREEIEVLEVSLRRGDGKAFRYRLGPLLAGQSKSLPLEVPPRGEAHFTAAVVARISGETRTANLDFAAEIVAPAVLTLDRSRVDLATRTLQIASSRPTARVEVDVSGDRGEPLGHTEVSFQAAPPGRALTVSWNQSEGRVLKIAVRVWDPDQFYAGVELFPWRLEIPHEEVHFETNSSAIDPVEEPKLDASLALVREAVARHGVFADVKLFVAGHTDTVGPAEKNRALSFQRARAIADYFRKSGLSIPVLFDGFGEDALEVETPDETDERRNRRAEYLVAVEPPAIASRGRPADWKRLK